MTSNLNTRYELHTLDLVAIEREARAMQARAIADMLRSLRRGVVALFTRGNEARTA
ncbi:MAG: RSP_7527 family protein [Pararhodobacter sp.]